ncbi:CHASE domain-containing protein, partial [Edwardsiella piscicida]|uniref:CHASE domain-containing protein n=1 Tax=Edwardsiella piscicida TaxID=1263550 RepID=UPI0011B23967
REYPGVRGIGFIQRVARADLSRFVQQARIDDKIDFTPHQIQPQRGLVGRQRLDVFNQVQLGIALRLDLVGG